MLMPITLEALQEIFESRINGRSVTVQFKNGNICFPATFDSVEMVVYSNGEVQFIEEDCGEAHYTPVFQSDTIEEILFYDHAVLPGHTGGQALINFKNGDSLTVTADF